MKKELSENLTSIWLKNSLIKKIKMDALINDVSVREYTEEFMIRWVEHRIEVDEALSDFFGYPYLRTPSKAEGDDSNAHSVYLSPNTSTYMRKYAKADNTSISSVVYTALYHGLFRPIKITD